MDGSRYAKGGIVRGHSGGPLTELVLSPCVAIRLGREYLDRIKASLDDSEAKAQQPDE